LHQPENIVEPNNVPQEKISGQAPVTVKSSKGKYITLAILLTWVAGVLIFTMLKFKGFSR
jgi:hypothetical protein